MMTSPLRSICKNIPALITCSLLGSVFSLSAETSSLWENTAAAGLSLAKGNSDNLSYNLHLLSSYELDNIEANFAEANDYLEKAVANLESAQNIHQSNRNKMCWALLCLIPLGIVLICWLLGVF